MKKLYCLLTVLSVTVFAVSCGTKTDDFSAEFNIKGIESESVYVTVFGLRDSVKLDLEDPEKPVFSVSDGCFRISGKTPQDVVIRASFSKDRRLYKNAHRGYYPNKASSLWFVASPGMNIKVDGDLTDKNFVDIYPETGLENKLFAKLSSALMPLQSRIGDLMVQNEMDTTLTAELRAANFAEMERLDEESQKVRMDFIRENPSSVAALWIMEDMLVRSQVEPAELEPILAGVDAKYADNYFYCSVADRLEGARSAAVGAPCPRIEGVDINGNAFNIKDMEGKYTIVDFWGTWCGACLSGMPAMKAFRDAHADRLQIVGIAQDKDADAVKACMEKNGMDWPNIMCGTGETDYVAKFNVQGFPTKILVDPRGKIVFRMSGESEEFYTEVEKLIK